MSYTLIALLILAWSGSRETTVRPKGAPLKDHGMVLMQTSHPWRGAGGCRTGSRKRSLGGGVTPPPTGTGPQGGARFTGFDPGAMPGSGPVTPAYGRV